MKSQPGERIITAYANCVSLPGEYNQLISVIVMDLRGDLREECLQKSEQTEDMKLLYWTSNVAHISMTNLVISIYEKPAKKEEWEQKIPMDKQTSDNIINILTGKNNDPHPD